jgi:ubiquitin carboxyl-terminal hydrolase 5/13
VPTKLDIPIIVSDDCISLDQYLSSGQQPGEQLLPDDAEESKPSFVPSEILMAQLEAIGFPKPRCEKALYNTGNADVEAATNWLFGHMEDPDIDEPLVIPEGGSKAGPSQDQIDMVTNMGFSPAQAKKALKEANGNVEAAVEWIFSHLDDTFEEEDEVMTEAGSSEKKEDSGTRELPANFELNSIVCHKGGSIHAGHYVAFVKKDLSNIEGEEGENWVLFNDEKVVKSGDVTEMKKFAYVLLLYVTFLKAADRVLGMSTSSRGRRVFHSTHVQYSSVCCWRCWGRNQVPTRVVVNSYTYLLRS